VIAVLQNSNEVVSHNEQLRTSPTRYLRRLESGPFETGEGYSQSGYATFVTSAKPAIPAQKAFETMHSCTNVDSRTWDLATRVIKQNLKQVDMHFQEFTRGKRTLSPTCISFMRFLASGFRTPSHGVVPAASKSSTLNLDADPTEWKEGNWN
jgi:hypothetical protein